MRVDEVTLPAFRDSALQRLIAGGWNQLGHGSNAVVLQKPGVPYVIKLFDANDKAYLTFVSVVKSNPNPHFPKFLGRGLVKVTDHYYAIRMEPLKEYVGHRGDDLDMVYMYLFGIGKDPNLYPLLQSPEYAQIQRWAEQNPSLKQACDMLYQHHGDFIFDIKIDNVMLRGNTFVFIDPYKTAFH